MLKVYGASDDLIAIEGDIREEFCVYFPALLVFSDGTILFVSYGKGPLAIWNISVVKRGTKFDSVLKCDDELTCGSDVAMFEDGIEWMYFAADPIKVKAEPIEKVEEISYG